MKRMVEFYRSQGCRLKFVISSGDGDDYPGCKLYLSLLSFCVMLRLPPIIRPYREKVKAMSWSDADIKRMGRDWYYHYAERRYGFYLFENHFNIVYGREADYRDTKEQRWSCFLPWEEWRMVRHSLYDNSGRHYWSGCNCFDDLMKARSKCPSKKFVLNDFDGEEIEATTQIEEREWRLGAGKFKWLSFFVRPKIKRSLDIYFSKETGKRKGSWKGGTIGHGIDMLKGELHEAAFRRYCEEHEMKFVCEACC